MKNGTINLSETQTIPTEGYFKPNGNVVSLWLKSTDLGASTINLAPKATLNEAEDYATMQDSSDSDISIEISSGVACFKSFEVDSDILMKFELDSGTTGSFTYRIAE